MNEFEARATALFEAEPTTRHMRPIVIAWAQGVIGMAFVRPVAHPRKFTGFPGGSRRAFVAVVGDDPNEPAPSVGPDGFDRKQLSGLTKASAAVIVVAGIADPALYALAADLAIDGQSVLMVETRPEYELAWAGFFHERFRPVLLQSPNAPREGGYFATIEEMRRRLRQ